MAWADSQSRKRQPYRWLFLFTPSTVTVSQRPGRAYTLFSFWPTQDSFTLVVTFFPLLCACSLPSHHSPSIKPRDKGLTLVFGSDGQVSLIGLDDGVASETLGTFTVSSSAALTSGTRSLSGESTPVLSIPNLEATSASLSGQSSFAPRPTSISDASSLPTSSFVSSSTTDTDTSLPSIPTVNYPSPSPTAVSSPKDHGVGAPFYLAIVLASLSFVGCVAAFIAWWIRSRTRGRALDQDDPWIPHDTVSDTDGPFDGKANESHNGARAHAEAQKQPYYLPAPIDRRNSSNAAIPSSENSASLQYGIPRIAIGAAQYKSMRRLSPRARPGAERSQTGLSVQESMRTLGRLRVANRVPGDVTSGDEGGMNLPRLQNRAELLPIMNSGESDAVPAQENMQGTYLDQSGRSVQDGDALLEPPGPATVSWGRRIDNAAALRRPRRRTPQMTAQTYKNARYGGYLYPGLDGEPSGTMGQTSAANQKEEKKASSDVLLDPLGWTSTLKSSFWQAVDVMTRSRSSDSETRAPDLESGSRFTPAPQRITSRRSPASPTHPDDSSMEPSLPEESTTTQKTPQNSFYSVLGSFSTRTDQSDVSHTSEDSLGRPDSVPPRVSNLNIGASAHQQHPESLRTDTGSLYSTDSAAARANLRKYGYGVRIPSTWSALGAIRESQLDLDHPYLPLPRPILGSSTGSVSGTGSLSITPSQLTPASSVRSRGSRSSFVTTSTSTRTRTPFPLPLPLPIPVSLHSGGALLAASDTGTAQSDGHSARTEDESNLGETVSLTYTVSRNSTVLSGRSAMSLGTVRSQGSTPTTSTLSRKKGVATRRRRPRPPTRAPSTASSVQSVESALSVKELAVRRALLERRKRVRAAATGSASKSGEDEVDDSQTAAST